MSSQILDDFLLAGNYSEIAFANTGGKDLDVIKQALRKKIIQLCMEKLIILRLLKCSNLIVVYIPIVRLEH